MIGEALVKNDALTKLVLGSDTKNFIGVKKESILIDKWKRNLADNNIGDEGARMIGESLMVNTILTELWLDGGDIKNEQISIK